MITVLKLVEEGKGQTQMCNVNDNIRAGKWSKRLVGRYYQLTRTSVAEWRGRDCLSLCFIEILRL